MDKPRDAIKKHNHDTRPVKGLFGQALDEIEDLKRKLAVAVEALENNAACGDCCPINYCEKCQKRSEEALKQIEGE